MFVIIAISQFVRARMSTRKSDDDITPRIFQVRIIVLGDIVIRIENDC